MFSPRLSLLARSLVLAAVLPAASLHAQTTGLSEASAASVVLTPLSVIAMPALVVSGASHASAHGSQSLSQTLSTQTDWTVVGMRGVGDKTELELASTDAKLRMTIAVPSAEAARRGIRLQDRITMKQLGQSSFSALHAGRPLGVLADPTAGLVHSKAR